MSYQYRPLTDLNELAGFRCGIKKMDNFIRNGLADSVNNNYCRPYGVYDDEGELVAFFAISFDCLELSIDFKEDLRDGFAETELPQIFGSPYGETFLSKLHYPALEITYLAVREDRQHMGIGEACVDVIINMANEQTMAGCIFLTVDALIIPEYSAVGFYRKCHFTQAEDRKPYKETLRLYYAL